MYYYTLLEILEILYYIIIKHIILNININIFIKMELTTFLGVLHLGCMVLENMYGFIFPKHFIFDKLYIFSFVLITFSWLVFKDECIFSYLMKKHANPDYILGSDPGNVEDISNLFYTKELYNFYYHTNHLVRFYSLLIVNNRDKKILHTIWIPTFILYTIYVYDIFYNFHLRITLFPYLQFALGYYVCTIFFTIIDSRPLAIADQNVW